MFWTVLSKLRSVWPKASDIKYFKSLLLLFPSIQDEANIPVDEFGPELYTKQDRGLSILLLVLDRTILQEKEWLLVVTSEWQQTLSKCSAVTWITADRLNGYTRTGRNTLILKANQL